MKKIAHSTIVVYFISNAILISCHSGTNSEKKSQQTDSATITFGESSFIRNCSGCHNFRQNGIGPSLNGISQDVDWLYKFIYNPQKMITSGDKRAKVLYAQYHTIMPAFNTLPDNEIRSIIAFLNSHNQKDERILVNDTVLIKDPIPKKIEFSGLITGLELITQFPPSNKKTELPLARITKMSFARNIKGYFVADLNGKLYKQVNNKYFPYIDIASLRPKFINEPGLGTGLGSFAFHPKFSENGLFYTTHTEPSATTKADFATGDTLKKGLQWVLTEWKTENPSANIFKGTSRELLRIDFVSSIHGVQEITFAPIAKPGDKDYGLLYIGVGDGGCVENGYPQLAHSISKIWGTVIRIDPTGSNSANKKYGIPTSNPFINIPGAVKEIYAFGFRNPHRITWTKKGLMLVSNIGQGNIESVNIVGGSNDFGWPVREGNFQINPSGNLNVLYPLPNNDSTYFIKYPTIEYDHDEGSAISGGYEYIGNSLPILQGKFIFGDIPTGRLFYSEISDLRKGKKAVIKEWKISMHGTLKSLKELCGSDRVDLHFGIDDKGEIYILTKADGKLYRLVQPVIR